MMAGFTQELSLGDGLAWLTLLAFALVIHHGLDADHLATKMKIGNVQSDSS